MIRLWRASFRRNQWNRLFGYKSGISYKAAGCSIVVWICIFSVASYAGQQLISAKSGGELQHEQSIFRSSGNRHLLASTSANTINYNGRCVIINVTDTDSVHGPVWERCDWEQSTNLHGVFIFVYIFLTMIIFIAVAIVCDDFFVPTLEAISEKLELSEDVAGATFMAAGSSAPELFSSIAGVAFNSDVGVGTITGSAVFNLLVIIALTAAFAGKVLSLDWRPLVRDSVFYAISIGWLIYSAWDSFFQAWEAAIMLSLYIVYIIIMIFNSKLMNFMNRIACKCCCTSVEPADTEQGDVAMETVRSESHSNLNGVANNAQRTRDSVDSRRMSTLSHTSLSGETKIFRHDRRNSVIHTLAASRPSLRGDEKVGASGKRGSILPSVETFGTKLNMQPVKEEVSTGSDEDDKRKVLKTNSSSNVKTSPRGKEAEIGEVEDKVNEEEEEEQEEDEEDEEEPHIDCCCACCPAIRGAPPPKPDESSSCGAKIIYVLKWIIFVLAFPFLVLFSVTIPDCSKENHKTTCWVLSGFLMSVFWIAGLSFGMVTLVARTGCLIGVDSFVMSLVVLAAGTSIPDLLSSIIVARDGYGDMAVSNAIGSNVFDIDLGLGLPFLIRIIASLGEPFDILSQDERNSYCSGKMMFLPQTKFGFILLGILSFAITVFCIARFRLNKIIGISFFIMYICFLAYAFVQEFLCNKTGKYNC